MILDTAPIKDVLAPLIGLPLYSVCRAGTLLMVGFGEGRPTPTPRAPNRITGSHALHVTCPWRFSGTDGIIAGAWDMYTAADPDTPESEFDPGTPGNAVADVRLREWMANHYSRPLTVMRVVVDRCGGFALHLSDDYAIEIIPIAAGDSHEQCEQWRLFGPGSEKRHFVWTEQGVLKRDD